METTPVYGLKKFDPDEFYDVTAANSNTDLLEGALGQIEQGMVKGCTHIREGSVHALTGEAGAGYIAFTATADFTDGDSFTVNGKAVTAATVDGAVLHTGDFAAGQRVIASVEGERLTFPWRSPDVPPEMHRMIFKGRNLGNTVTEEQKARIQDGSFRDLYLGDYWVIDGRTWRIADIDYWYNCGDIAFTKHHLVIMPDETLYNAQMNTTDTTEGGYVGSEMYTESLTQAKTMIDSAFPGIVLNHRELLVNAVTNGYPSGGAWYDSSVELPNEIMMYGSHVFTPAGNGTINTYRYTIDNSQLALMAAVPKLIKTRQSYWFRDVVSAAHFAFMGSVGNTASYSASYSLGVRPVFAIG